jgi:hypothetical protein
MSSVNADRITTEIYDAIHDNVATKQDVELLRTDLKAEIAAVRTDMRELEQRLEVRFTQIERRIDLVVTRLGALAVVLLGLLFGALHLWPPK